MDVRRWGIVLAMGALVLGLLAAAIHAGAGAPGNSTAADVSNASRAATAGRAPAETQVRRVSPVGADGALRARYSVAATGRGHCWTSSFMNPRAYRCFQGKNLVMDPCWEESGRASVACLLRPWSTKVTRLRLTQRLPRTGAGRVGTWGLRLRGVRVDCLAAMGATGLVGHLPMTFSCPRGWVLLGSPDRSRPLWTIATAELVGHHYELRGRRPISTAWKAVVPSPSGSARSSQIR